MRSRLLIITLLTTVFWWCSFGIAHAADLAVSPAIYEQNLKAGQAAELAVNVTNHGVANETIQLSVGNRPEDVNVPLDWVTINSAKSVTVGNGNSSTINFTVKPGTDAKTGFYRLALFITPNTDTTQDSASVVGRLAVSLDINVLGNDELGQQWQAAPPQLEIKSIKYHRRWWPGPLKVSLTVKNIGPWKGTPHGTVRLANRSGRHWQAPVNLNQIPLLPNQEATYELEVPADYHVGPLYGESIVALMNETPALQSTKIWVFPWFGPLLLGLTIVWLGRRTLRRRSR